MDIRHPSAAHRLYKNRHALFVFNRTYCDAPWYWHGHFYTASRAMKKEPFTTVCLRTTFLFVIVLPAGLDVSDSRLVLNQARGCNHPHVFAQPLPDFAQTPYGPEPNIVSFLKSNRISGVSFTKKNQLN
ncbi:hypothetical protein ACTJK4_05815 [Ralstonia sp. 22111]|uniref:hypothetical protein n=1 Tax=Ralstonia sp. 22111 TaxID=3453878 RepID=UPI003F87A56B